MSTIVRAGRFTFDVAYQYVMGILNVTPDSFSDGGKYNTVDSALFHVEEMLNDGADIIDIGAESTRPGAALVSEATELERLLPVIEAIQKRFHCCLSIDTNKPTVMSAVLDRNIDMINDVRGLVAPGALETVAYHRNHAAVCIMHMQGLPESMQHCPTYHDVISEVCTFLHQRADAAVQAGIDTDRIIIDPGFGFGKTPEQNMLLLKHCREIAEKYPVLFGLSRKSTLGVLLGDEQADRTSASVAGALLAVQNGASIVRVHDVKATKDALTIYRAMNVYSQTV